jgi:diguanylate cyclase (GGDEF)-like protein
MGERPLHSAHPRSSQSRAGHGPKHWAFWTLPRAARWYVTAVEAAAVAVVVAEAFHGPVTLPQLRIFGILVVLGIVEAESARRVERIRRRLADAPHINMTSVWTFAAVLTLPAALAALVAVLLYTHLGLRSWYRIGAVPPHRMVFSASMIVLSGMASSRLLRLAGVSLGQPGTLPGLRDSVFVITAAVVFGVVNAALLAGVIRLTAGRGVRLVGTLGELALELATLFLAVFTALATSYQPLFAVLAVPLASTLHRGAFVKQLEVAATIDDKTGLLNAITWNTMAHRELGNAQRAGGTFAVLMLDLDHFKRVNDAHGHLAGDVVLKRVADAVRAEVRRDDYVGRFGGEELCVLLPGFSGPDAVEKAERVRCRIRELAVEVRTPAGQVTVSGLSASIGVCVYPDAGLTLDDLLLTADEALYRAKNTGRDRVVCAARLPARVTASMSRR